MPEVKQLLQWSFSFQILSSHFSLHTTTAFVLQQLLSRAHSFLLLSAVSDTRSSKFGEKTLLVTVLAQFYAICLRFHSCTMCMGHFSRQHQSYHLNQHNRWRSTASNVVKTCRTISSITGILHRSASK